MIKLIALLLCCCVLISCDFTVWISLRNYREACNIKVDHQNLTEQTYYSDTLFLTNIDNPEIKSSVIRTNTSPNKYFFTCPKQVDVALNPIALGTPIKQVDIINASDSLWSINLWNRKEFKKLKKSGQIKTKGFIFTHQITIENK